MLQSVNNSLESAFGLLIEEGLDHRGDCLNDDKWDSIISEQILYLGWLICSRSMTIEWPYKKQMALYKTLQSILQRKKPIHITPKEMASIIGTVRSAANVGSWGVFLSAICFL